MKLAPFKLERYFAKYEFTTRYLLCSSDCESWTIQDILDLEPGSAEAFAKLRLGYGESQGGLALRREVCRLYTTIAPEQLLVHSGAEEPIFLFMNALLEAGDELIVQQPCYQALHEIPRGLGCKVLAWNPRAGGDWRWDLRELEALLSPRTKGVVVNNPHNPTGALMSREQLAELAALCERRGLTLLSDEVYRESEYRPELRLPAACDLSPRAVSLGVTSKTYGLAGLRIGWIATRDQRLLERIAELRDYTTICNSGPSEFLATIALRHRELLAARNLELIADNLERLDAFFARHESLFEWSRPKAGPIAFPRVKRGNAAELCHELATKAGVLLLPGEVFGEAYAGFVRVGFGRRNLPEALEQLALQLSRQSGA